MSLSGPPQYSPPAGPPSGQVGVAPGRAGSIPTVWLRIAARLFDEFVLAVPRLALTIPYMEFGGADGIKYDPPKWVVALSVLIPLLYDFVFVAVRSATPGKSLFGMAVRNAADGGKVMPYQAGLRAVIPSLGSALALAVPVSDLSFLFAMVTPLVYASVTWDARRRGLHDKAAGTIVLRTD